MITKREALQVAGKNRNYWTLINIFLINLILKGICSYDDLSLREKQSLNRILEGRHKLFYFNRKVWRITERPREVSE